MLLPMYMIKNAVNRAEIMDKNIKNKIDDLVQEKSKLYGIIYDIKLACKELSIGYDESFNDYIYFLEDRMENIESAETAEDIKNVLSRILARFKSLDTEKNISTYDLDFYYKKYNEYSYISHQFIQSVVSAIKSDRKYNVFDTRCKSGESLKQFKDDKNSVRYGLEKDNDLAEIAKQYADKIIKGEIKGSRISNDAFDVLINNCLVSPFFDDNLLNGSVIRLERQQIQNTLKYLKNDGIAIISMPYYRLYKDICTILARALDNVIIIRGIGELNENTNQVYIVGKKSRTKEINEDIYNELRDVGINYETNCKTLFSITMPEYKITGKYTEVDLFKGSILDMDELFNIVTTSGCLDAFFNKQNVDKIHENTKQPLLPFNVGQIGLVLTSGCLDGIIDEGDGNCHLVKGRVSKKSDIKRDVSNGVVEETEVVSNRVEINVILPNGDFKTLA